MATLLDESMEVSQTGDGNFIAQIETSGVVTPLEHSCLEGIATYMTRAPKKMDTSEQIPSER